MVNIITFLFVTIPRWFRLLREKDDYVSNKELAKIRKESKNDDVY